jgi:CDP-glucose 4,6-dehydratase
VDTFTRLWGGDARWEARPDGGPHEATFLKLDCSKLKTVFGWRPRWSLETALEKTVEWSRVWLAGGDVRACMDGQIAAFLSAPYAAMLQSAYS